MKIAIIGAGFCGLAAAWHLAEDGQHEITLFDSKGIGAGASGIKAGLLHTYHGPKAKPSWKAEEAFGHAVAQLMLASSFSQKPLFYPTGVLRPQIEGMDFSSASYRDTEWWDTKQCQQALADLAPVGGLFIRSGLTVDCPAYLDALWRACQTKKVALQIETIHSPDALRSFDMAIFCVGAGLIHLKKVEFPAVSLIKGQALELACDEGFSLPFALNSGVQVLQTAPGSLWVGATYERRWAHEGIDSTCEVELRGATARLNPSIARLKTRSIVARFRAATSDKRPFIAKTGSSIYCVGGLGSKGLLYHAWLAWRLKEMVFSSTKA